MYTDPRWNELKKLVIPMKQDTVILEKTKPEPVVRANPQRAVMPQAVGSGRRMSDTINPHQRLTSNIFS